MISFQNVSKTYNGKTALNHFSLDIYDGELLTVIGTSGCGKTTALKMINRLLQPDTGNIFVIFTVCSCNIFPFLYYNIIVLI